MYMADGYVYFRQIIAWINFGGNLFNIEALIVPDRLRSDQVPPIALIRPDEPGEFALVWVVARRSKARYISACR
jgi:hypothetical protein